MKKIALIFLITLTSCHQTQKPLSITIGSKSFTEQEILGEIMAQLIEAKLNIPVTRKFYLGGTMVCLNALKKGDIDIYPEYTGTALISILNYPSIADRKIAFSTVSKEFQNKYEIAWMPPLGLNNSYTLTMQDKQSKKLGIAKISQLRNFQNTLKAGFDHEFMDRPDGYAGLARRYGLHFKNRPIEMDPGLMYKAIQNGQVDLICGYTTDGRIAAYKLTILEDDLNFFPPYEAAPIVRQETLQKIPHLREVLELLSGKITDEKMRAMNFAVDEEHRDIKLIAREFLLGEKLIEK